MTLVCTKCGSGSRIEREGNELHCKFCGNVVVDGVTARWPIVEKETYKPAKNISTMGTKPVVRENRITEKEEEKIMGKAGKCKVEGCEKNQVAGGLCYKHYHAKHGEPYKPKTHRGEKKAADKPTKEWPDKAKDQIKATAPVGVKVKVSAENKGPMIAPQKPEKVIIDFTDYPELYQAIHKQAKESYRTIAGQMLYHIRVLIKIGEEAA